MRPRKGQSPGTGPNRRAGGAPASEAGLSLRSPERPAGGSTGPAAGAHGGGVTWREVVIYLACSLSVQVRRRTLQMFTALIPKLIIWAGTQNKNFKSHTQIHTARKWQSWGLNPGSSAAALNTYIPKSSKMIGFVCLYIKARAPSQQLLSSSCLPFFGATSQVHTIIPIPQMCTIIPLLLYASVPLSRVEMLLCPK